MYLLKFENTANKKATQQTYFEIKEGLDKNHPNVDVIFVIVFAPHTDQVQLITRLKKKKISKCPKQINSTNSIFL